MYLVSWQDTGGNLYTVSAPNNKTAWMVYWMARKHIQKERYDSKYDAHVYISIIDSRGNYRDPLLGEALGYADGPLFLKDQPLI